MRTRQGVAKGFTATRVASLPAGRYKDPGQPSLYLLVRDRADNKPSRTWLHRIKAKAEDHSKDTDTFLVVGHYPETSLEAARDTVRQQRELRSKGIDPRRAAPRRHPARPARAGSSGAPTVAAPYSIEHLCNEFMERHVRPNRKRPEYAQAILSNNVVKEWRGRDVRTIKPREVIELLDKIVARGSKTMANRTADLLNQMFRFGIHRAIIEDTPVKLLMRPGGPEKPRQRALSDTELQAYLLDPLACTRHARLAHVITLLLLTGQRRGELAAARWRDIDFQALTWRIPPENSKTARELLVPLAPWAGREFEQLKKAAGRSPWVLPGIDTTQHVEPKLLTRGMARCTTRLEKAGIAPFTLHDLRRTCRTGLARLRIAAHIAERVLGHAPEKIAGTYDTHDYLDERRVASEKWAAHLWSLIEAEEPN